MLNWLNQLPRWLFWEITIPLTALNLWLLSLVFRSFEPLPAILTVAALLAFLLDYPIQYLQQRGIKRIPAILCIIVLVLVVLGGFGFIFVPMLIHQLRELTDRLPIWITSSDQQLQAVDEWLTVQKIPLDLSALTGQLAELLPAEVTMLPDEALASVLSLADSVIDILLTTVLTLYFLLYGQEFWQGLFQWLPHKLSDEIRQVVRRQFQNYFVGQATIAMLMGIVLTITFFFLKIPFWLVFGLGIGVTVLIPFGDFVGIALVTLLVSLKSLWLGGEVLMVSLIADQVIDNAIAPKLIGNLVGLNPIWVIISLLVGFKLGGLLGLLIAVPLTGTVNSIASRWETLSDLGNKIVES